MRRIFVAVDISEEARGKVAAYIDSLRGEFRDRRVGWEKPEKLHLTLKFLGDTNEKQLGEVRQSVENTAREISDFKLRVLDTGVFPNTRNPRVLWIDVQDAAGNLKEINSRLETDCEKIGFAKEKRSFVPHLTIGRIREPAGARALAEKHLENGFEPVEFEISEIVIYESKLLPTGSVYSVVSKHRLGLRRGD